MTWSGRRNAVSLVSGSRSVLPLPATSVAVIRPDMAASPLRMYGVTPTQINTAALLGGFTFSGYVYQAWYATASDGENLFQVGYIPGDRGTSGQDFRPLLGSNVITSTNIIAAREVSGVGESVVCFDYASSTPGTKYVATFLGRQLLRVRYKDPCVLYLPSINRWMMVLCRVRIFANRASVPTSNANPFTTISDIVAYTDTTSTFDSADLLGPFWLADSTSGMNVPYRLSLGVPCAFEYADASGTTYLYLYFSVDPCNLTSSNNPQLDSTVFVDIPGSAGYPGASYTPQLGVKVMLTSHFLTSPTGPEQYWEIDYNTYTNNIVPGVMQGEVRLWAAVFGSASYEVVSFEEAMVNVRAVDPALVVDATNANQTNPNPRAASYSAGENISLYFAANMVSLNQYVPYLAYGIWRASAVPESWLSSLSVLDTNGTFMYTQNPTFGVDFIVRHISITRNGLQVQGMDHVTQSTAPTNATVDPEPALLYNGTWRLFMGHGDVYTPGGVVMLQYVENNSYTDVFCPISNAWS